MDFLLLIDDDKSHYVYIKDFDKFISHKTKNKNKKYFWKSCLQCFSSKNRLTQHKDVCLSINGAQSVKLEKGTIEFKNYFKEMPAPFKIYADFQCNLKVIETYEDLYTKNIKITFLVVLLAKLFVLMIALVSELLFLRVKMLLLYLLKQFIKSMSTAKK